MALGRITKEDKIDSLAGIVLNKKIGDKVEKGETLAYIHTNLEDRIEEAEKSIQKHIKLVKQFQKNMKTF